jgi:anti-sigma B factor antagonist
MRIGMRPMLLTTEVDGPVATIRVEGEVDASNASEVRDAFLAVLSDGAVSLVIDCEKLSFIDSMGLSAIVSATREAKLQWGTVTVRNASDIVRRVLDITGLHQAVILEP